MKTYNSSRAGFGSIAKAYIEDSVFRNEFYTFEHNDMDAYFKRIQYLENRTYNREALSDALTGINKKLGAGAQTFINIEKLRSKDAVCIVTGQQTGVLGGPLYTLYKAATAVKMAKTLTEKMQKPVVPIFWMASEDHDFEEARSIVFIDDNKPKNIKIDKKPGTGNNNPYKTIHNYTYLKEPVGWVDANVSVKHLLLEARHAWSGTPYGDWCESIFEQTLVEDETISAWFGRIYAQIFNEEGLIIVDPLDREIRKLGIHFLKTAALKSTGIVQSVVEKGDRLSELGFTPMIQPREGATGLYYLEQGERLAIIRENEMFTIREGDEREGFCLKNLHELMEKKPEDFSTNVILRPVIQDEYLPTVAYVAGPGETAYYAQLKDVYSYFEMEMPMILLRENYTVVKARTEAELRELGISTDSIIERTQEDIERQWLDDRDHLDVEGLFDAFEKRFEADYTELMDKLSRINSEITTIQDKNLALIQQQFEYLKKKSHSFHRRNHRQALQKIQNAYHWIKPYGNIQERVMGLVNILSIGGKPFKNHITQDLEYDMNHRIIVIDEEGEKS